MRLLVVSWSLILWGVVLWMLVGFGIWKVVEIL